ncbi:MAG: DUF302 domain-containing protein [Acidimicrobiales bacterium]
MDALETTVAKTMSDAEADVRGALSRHGFGVLTEIDVAATLQAKLGLSRRPLKILGACNPTLAHRALELDPTVALVLPCNVVLEDIGERRTRVAIADPRALIGAGAPSGRQEQKQLADEAAASLEQVIEDLGG